MDCFAADLMLSCSRFLAEDVQHYDWYVLLLEIWNFLNLFLVSLEPVRVISRWSSERKGLASERRSHIEVSAVGACPILHRSVGILFLARDEKFLKEEGEEEE